MGSDDDVLTVGCLVSALHVETGSTGPTEGAERPKILERAGQQETVDCGGAKGQR